MHSLRVFVLGLLSVGSLQAACGDGGGFPDAVLPEGLPAPGTLSASWQIRDTGGDPIACERFGGQAVTLLLRNRGVAGGFTEVFSCSTGMGTTPSIPAGVYDVSFELSATGFSALATAPQQVAVTVTPGGNTVLEAVVFSFDATGGLDLGINSLRAGGNCGAAAAAGAGITSTTITLEHQPGSVCEPVTFAISAGATQPAGTYAVSCAAATPGPCIENDQRLTVTGVPTDNYRIRVRGLVGATTCYTNDDLLAVPPKGTVRTQTLNLGRLDLPACPAP